MSKRAFTLIELIMVMTIVGIISAMFVPFISAALDSWALNKSERDVMFSARLALNRMVREIRQTKDTNLITTFTATEFAFIDSNDNSINFRQSGNTLLRNSDELTDKLQNPGGLALTYLDSGGNVTGVRDDIRTVRIILALTSESSSVTVRSFARFRRIN